MMRRYPHGSILPFALCVLGAAHSLPAQAKVSSKELDNGLQVLVLANPASAFTTVQMVFRAGANVQMTPQDAGMAHFLEHMLFRRGESGSIESELSKIDAFTNGATDDESVMYYYTFPPKHLATAVDIMAKMIRRPTWSKGGLENERPIVRGELERRASDPFFHLMTESSAALWGDQAWTTHSPGGNVVSLNAATIDKLQKIYERYYVPNNGALIVSGPVKDTEVFDMATKAFGNWKKGADPFAAGGAEPVKPLTGIMRKVIASDVKDVTYMIRWQGPSTMKDPAHTHAADIFAGLVNQSISKAKKRLIDGGLVDELGFSYSTYRGVGPITLLVRTSEDRATAATRVIGEELAAIMRGDFFTEEELTLAKKLQQVEAHLRVESATIAAGVLSAFWAAGGLDYYAGYESGLAGQSMDDVKKFAATYLTGKPYTVVVQIPRFAAPAVRTSIEQGIVRWGAIR
jgi:zinc protease